MNKHAELLLQYPPHILKSRVESLRAELDRERESQPIKLVAFVATFLSLLLVGDSSGFNSAVFILSSLVIAGIVAVVAIGAWCLRANLRDSTAALEKATG